MQIKIKSVFSLVLLNHKSLRWYITVGLVCCGGNYTHTHKLPILKWPTEDKPLTFCTEINHCSFPLLTVKFNEHPLGSLGCTFVSGYVPEGSASYQACCSDTFIALILSETFNNITQFFCDSVKNICGKKMQTIQ